MTLQRIARLTSGGDAPGMNAAATVFDACPQNSNSLLEF